MGCRTRESERGAGPQNLLIERVKPRGHRGASA